MRRRGLTILEVLAAAVLLSVITAACLPLLGGARRWTDASRAPDLFAELIRLTDAVMADPEAFGLDPETIRGDGFAARVDLGSFDSADESNFAPGEGGSEYSLSVTLLTGKPTADESHPGPRHGWLVFQLGINKTMRHVELSDQEDDSEVSDEATR